MILVVIILFVLFLISIAVLIIQFDKWMLDK